jgi:predicted phage terminase large subunit-like protein
MNVMTLTSEHVVAARRELASRNLADFACLIDIPTVPLTEDDDEDAFSVMRLDSLAAHHALLLNKLQGIENGTVANLMVLMPPGSAKSTYADVVFVPWYMARKPRRNVILASYASDIAKKQGRRARQLIKSKSFINLMQVGLRNDQHAADEWALENGSEYMSGGLLSGLTGNRAALGILDDPIRGREAAESETIRNKTWDAYTDDFCSRLIPGAPQVMILTRWHEDDPAGRILPEGWKGESGVFDGRDGREWHVLCLPAIADRMDDPLGRAVGETLWPEWFNHDHWAPFKRNARTWASLYQQKPAPDEGTYFQRDAFNRYQKAPDSLRYYGTSDYAVTEGGGDYTRLRIWGVDGSVPSKVYLFDGWGGQTSSDQWIEAQVDLIARHRPLAWFGEGGVIQKAIEPALVRKMRDRRVSCRLEWLPSMSDKPTRARSAQAMVQEGRVYIRDDHDGDCFIDECVAFPAGRYDDDVDNISLIGRAMDQINAPAVHKARPPRSPMRGGWAGA